eukprot:2142939-Pyramimonas_sp.AAC.1
MASSGRAKSTIGQSTLEDIVKKHEKTIARLDIDGDLSYVRRKNMNFLVDLAEHAQRINRVDLQRAISKHYGDLPSNEVK